MRLIDADALTSVLELAKQAVHTTNAEDGGNRKCGKRKRH